MIIKDLIFCSLFLASITGYGQSQAVISSKKPLKDTSSQKGILGGRLSTGLEEQIDGAAKIKSEGKAIIEDIAEPGTELTPELLEEGRRVLVFSQFTSMLGLIEAELKARGLPSTRLARGVLDTVPRA